MDQRKHGSANGDAATMSLLSEEQRTHVDTARAAYYLGRKPQTMRIWASTESGPIRPIRVNGRLAWPVAVIRNLLGFY